MIYVGSRLIVSDNSGAKKVECIKLLNKSPYASIGDIIIVSIKTTVARQKTKVEKGAMYQAVIIETKNGVSRKDGSILRFERNAVVLISRQGIPLGNRLRGILTLELESRKHKKLYSLGSSII